MIMDIPIVPAVAFMNRIFFASHEDMQNIYPDRFPVISLDGTGIPGTGSIRSGHMYRWELPAHAV